MAVRFFDGVWGMLTAACPRIGVVKLAHCLGSRSS